MRGNLYIREEYEDGLAACSVASLGLAGQPDGTAVPPVPPSVMPVWAVPFFECVSALRRERPDLRLYIPMHYYLDALSDHVDGAYLKLWAAIDNLCSDLLRDRGIQETLVRDGQAWNLWAQTQATAATAFASEGNASRLADNIRLAARPTDDQLVEIAFDQVGLTLLPEMATVLRERRGVILKGLSVSGELARVPAIVHRLAIVRCMLVALIARLAKYSGPLAWDFESSTAPQFWRPMPDQSNADTSRLVHRISHRTTIPFGTSAWPRFEPLQVPADGLIGKLASFAGTLRDRTGSEVEARVDPLPSDDDETYYDFKLSLPSRPETQSTLFTIEPFSEGIRIVGWGEGELEVRDEEALRTFIREVATSSDTKRRIQQFLTLASRYR